MTPYSAPLPAPRACRTLFLSDLHLGALGAQSHRVLAFLQQNPAETYVLVGDVLDLWRPKLPHWSDADQAVIDHLNHRQAEGAQIVYLRGNHDPDPAHAPEGRRPLVPAVDRYAHQAADGRRFLVIHGHQFDSTLLCGPALTRLGSRLDHGLRRFDRALQRVTRARRDAARSPIEALLARLNTLMHADRKHERKLVDLARAEGFDGVICGHFHLADLHAEHGLVYANCGDWVDSLSAVIETFSGSLRLVGGSDTAPAPQATAHDLVEA